VQNHGKLAGERDLRLAHAGASSQAHPPLLVAGQANSCETRTHRWREADSNFQFLD
jgi:hypothetical protein